MFVRADRMGRPWKQHAVKHTGLQSVWFQFYEMPRLGESAETESKLVIAGGTKE